MEEELHVMERVGVACRKLEHPDSGCSRNLASFQWELLLIMLPVVY